MTTTITNISQRILDENGYVLTDIPNLTLTILEYKIDDAIVWVNLTAGVSISALSGSAGSKSLTATDEQNLIIKWLTNAMIRAYLEKGAQNSIAGLNVSIVVNDSDSSTTKMMLKAVERLKKPPIYLANALPDE